MGAVVGFVAAAYAAASAGGEVARGGLALALLGDPDRRRRSVSRLAAYALAGATFWACTGAVTAALLTYGAARRRAAARCPASTSSPPAPAGRSPTAR